VHEHCHRHIQANARIGVNSTVIGVPIPKSASIRGELGANFGIENGTVE
jgi:hypothetical protein